MFSFLNSATLAGQCLEQSTDRFAILDSMTDEEINQHAAHNLKSVINTRYLRLCII